MLTTGGRRLDRMAMCGLSACAVLLTSVSCSTDFPVAAPPSTSVSATAKTPQSTPNSSASQAVTAYNGLWRAMAKAATTSDWRDPELAKFATGDALAVVTRSLYLDHQNGVVTRGAPKTNPHATSVSSTKVVIADCGDDSEWLKYKANGQLQNDTPGGRRAITAEVQRQTDGSWRVTRFAVEGVGSC